MQPKKSEACNLSCSESPPTLQHGIAPRKPAATRQILRQARKADIFDANGYGVCIFFVHLQVNVRLWIKKRTT